MLLKIREKSQGVFAWVILLLICVPFALWGIQNYVGGGSESAIASVGGKDFYQQDLNRAYAQYSQNLQGVNFDENEIKKQALEKLIKDEVLLQYVESEGLVVTDKAARDFIKGLEYFQTDGKFNNKQYKALLATQRMSPVEFVGKIKKALVMEQFQRSVVESGFATEADIESFFKIQNQKRDVEVVSIAIEKIDDQPTDEEINSYYQRKQSSYLTAEKVAIEYIDLSLAELATKVEPSAEQLEVYYQEQKDLYTTKERRKISHILFAFTKDAGNDDVQLTRALKTKKDLEFKEFSDLAAEVSDDKLTAAKGGDLGLFNIGVMEKAFEDAASSLQLNQVSEPVKSAFGYHLIKVTELVAGDVKSFESVKDELTVAYQRVQAESTFYELGETLTELSFENPDSLQAVSDTLGIAISKTGLFSRNGKTVSEDVVSQPAVINAAFSDDVLKGDNSPAIELGDDRLLVLRMVEHQPAEVKALEEVKPLIIAQLLNEKAKKVVSDKAEAIKAEVINGKSLAELAEQYNLTIQKLSAITRSNGDLPWQVSQAIFKAAKPVDGKPVVVLVKDNSGSQTIINLLSVTEGVMTESDKAKKELAETNLANAFGQADFNAALNSLQDEANIVLNAPK
ncbi:MAG: peptidylprolyl isomerase [Methylococcaceae bacterium]|nr:peptidylprolyl isomerase [Methylococcaceae bacterium]